MPRGSYQAKPVKAAQSSTSAPVIIPISTTVKIESQRPSLLSPSLISRHPSRSQPSSRDSSQQRAPQPEKPSGISGVVGGFSREDQQKTSSTCLAVDTQMHSQSMTDRTKLVQIAENEDAEGVLSSFGMPSADSQSSATSSLFSVDSTSIYSRASSVYSREESIYSFDDSDRKDMDSVSVNVAAGSSSLSRRSSTIKSSDTVLQERSSLAKKATMYKNSRLAPGLSEYTASLPTWAMACRAIQASQDCYDHCALTRKGTYTAADTSKDIKAMIVDDQLIDGSRLVIVAIRGTKFESLSDWAVNADNKPTKPTGFLDDGENLCHGGFLQTSRAMISQVASQLRAHPAASERPSLLFTGHSAGGAVAAMLYSHMLSTSCDSELIRLAKQFPIIHCMTFGAPPLTLTPLPRRDNGSGVFLAFTNEGDPVPKLSNAAYFASLAKLRTAAPPACFAAATTAAPVKIVRGSRGSTIYKQTSVQTKTIPWEELPLWPTPPPSSRSAGEVVLLRDRDDGRVEASRVVSEDLDDAIWGDLAQHHCATYMQRIKELALAAMMGRH